MQTSRALLLLALALAAVCSVSHAAGRNHMRALKQDDGSTSDIDIPLDDGPSFANEPRFPFCRCTDYSAASNPYDLILNSTTFRAPNGILTGEHCLTIKYKGASANPTACYTALEENFGKLYFTIQPACVPAIDVTGRYFTINGRRRNTGWKVAQYPSGTAFQASALNFKDKSADGIKICIRAAAPCHIPRNFFDTLPITSSVIESGDHRCCPVTGPFTTA